MATWTGIRDELLAFAEIDLRADGAVRPTLAAFDGEEALFLAFLRPFVDGYVDPIIEVTALACPMGADRLALSVGARVWSADDPVVPVCDDGDLRQRVVVVHEVDGHGRDEPTCHTTLIPFDPGTDGPRFGEAVDPGAGEGWLPDVLRTIVGARGSITGPPEEILGQIARCDALGHEFAWGAGGLARLLETAERLPGAPTRRPPRGSPRPSHRGSTGRRGRRRSPHR